MKNKIDMEAKIEATVEKTVEALARIERFMIKYGSEMTKSQRERIASKVEELQKY